MCRNRGVLDKAKAVIFSKMTQKIFLKDVTYSYISQFIRIQITEKLSQCFCWVGNRNWVVLCSPRYSWLPWSCGEGEITGRLRADAMDNQALQPLLLFILLLGGSGGTMMAISGRISINVLKELGGNPQPVTAASCEPVGAPVICFLWLRQPCIWAFCPTSSHLDLWHALVFLYFSLIFFFFFKIYGFSWTWPLHEKWSLHSLYYVHKLVIYIDLHMIGT